MRKILMLLMLSVFLIGIVSAVNECGNDNSFLGFMKKGENITLTQTCDSCTFVNLSSIKYPNSSIKYLNTVMTKTGIEFNYTLNNTNKLGCYSYSVLGDKGGTNTAETIDFMVNGTGFQFTTANSLFYIALLCLLIFIFVLNILGIAKLPHGNPRADSGNIISISMLKYLKPALFVTAWGLVISILFISSSIAGAYLGDQAFSNFLFGLFKLSTVFAYPFMIISFAWLVLFFFKDLKLKQYLDRGYQPQ